MIPLYGFLEGDTVGLLLLGREEETVATLAERMQVSAEVRVARRARVRVVHAGHVLADDATLVEAGLRPLDRIDIVEAP
jgi:hypothetical protein